MPSWLARYSAVALVFVGQIPFLMPNHQHQSSEEVNNYKSKFTIVVSHPSYLKFTFAALNFSKNLALCVILSDSASLPGVVTSVTLDIRHILLAKPSQHKFQWFTDKYSNIKPASNIQTVIRCELKIIINTLLLLKSSSLPADPQLIMIENITWKMSSCNFTHAAGSSGC